jgi:hypothetical protein
LKYPATVPTRVPLIKSQLHHLNACGAGNSIRLPTSCLLIPKTSLVVGRTGFEPVSSAYKTAALTAAPPASRAPRDRTWRLPLYQSGPFNQLGRARSEEGEGADPTAARTVTGVQSPLPRRRRTFHGGTRRFRPPPFARPTAFGAVPATRRVLVPRSALRPGVNRPEMEEDGRLERQRLHARPVSGRGQPPDWFIFRGERVTRTPRRYPRSR